MNDPTTAVQVVDRLTDLLGRIADRPDPSGWVAGEAGVARVLVPVDGFDTLTTLAFAEIIRYGADSPQVARRLHSAFDSLESRAGQMHRPGLVEMRSLLRRRNSGNLANCVRRALRRGRPSWSRLSAVVRLARDAARAVRISLTRTRGQLSSAVRAMLVPGHTHTR